MNQTTPACQHYYEKLTSVRNGELPIRIEHVGMCRLRQSLNTNHPLQKIRLMQIDSAMKRAGGSTQNSDHCGFSGQYSCPYFELRPLRQIDPASA